MRYRETADLNPDGKKILENNQLLHVYTGLRNRGKRFINKAIRINQAGEPFSFMDFPEITKNSFKQYVFQLRHCGLIEVISKSVFAQYRVKGFRLNDFWEKLTTNPTEVTISNNKNSRPDQENIHQYIQEYFTDLDSPALHNIRLHFYDDNLYNIIESSLLESKSYTIHFSPRNKSYIIDREFSWESNCSVKIILTPKKLVQIIIKNTFRPLAYDEHGIYELYAKLGEVRNYLMKYSPNIPPVSRWLFVRADFGRDCKKPLNRMFPAMEFRDLSGVLVRIYAKSWPDGTTRLRCEKNITPNMQVIEILGNLKEENKSIC